MSEVKAMLNFLELDCEITELRKIGQQQVNRNRTLVFKVANKWHRNLILLSDAKLKNYSQQLFVSRELNATEAKCEMKNLTRRKDMIENWTNRTHIRIRDLKLYEKIGETWQEVEIGENENSGNWRTTPPVQNDLFSLLYNVRSLIDLSKRICLSTAFLISDYYDLLCLTETWLVSAIPDTALFLNGYSIHRNNRLSTDAKNKHGGVLIAKISRIRHTRIRIDPKYLETVTVEISLHEVDYLICCVYSALKPSQYRFLPQLMINLIDLLIVESKKHGCETILFVGDLNFENTSWKQMRSTDYSEALVVGKLFENSFQQLITTKSKLLDVILTNNTDSVLNVSVDNRVKTLYKSHHLPYRAKLSGQSWYRAEFKRKEAKKNDFTVFSYTRVDWVSLSKHIEENPFVLYCLSNVDMMVWLWYKWLYKFFQSHMPTKTRHRMSLPTWVSNETFNLFKWK